MQATPHSGGVMHLIRSSAFLHLCTCRRHAQIIYTNKSRSIDFGSREVGLDIIEEALQEKRLSPEEGCAVIEQIMSSPLPTERNPVDDKLDELREVQAELGSLGIEVFLSTSRPADESIRHQDQLES